MTTKSKLRPSPADPEGVEGLRAPASRATSYDVARLAGVSQSAVSRAFRDGASISETTRRKVEEAARELGYAPSRIARSLISQRSHMIAVVVTDVSNRGHPEILFHLGREIEAAGSRMLVFTFPSDEEVSAAVSEILAYHVDGIVSGGLLDEEALSVCDRHDVPVVLYNRPPRGGWASAVGCDHAAGMDLLVGHLLEEELRGAVFLAGPESAPVSNERLAGARAAFAARGMELARVVHGDYSYEGGRRAANTILSARDRPATVMCANDAMALGVMDACRFDLGLSVPEQISVTGFDDVPQAGWPSHNLTTLHQPVRRMAQTAVRLLMEEIEVETRGGERRLLAAELKIRRSSRADIVKPA